MSLAWPSPAALSGSSGGGTGAATRDPAGRPASPGKGARPPGPVRCLGAWLFLGAGRNLRCMLACLCNSSASICLGSGAGVPPR